MASLNKVFLIGNCGRDPEIRYLPSGQAVANVSIATTSRWKDKSSGEMVEDTQWHRVTFYDRLAEVAGEYLKKGSPVHIEGRLKYGKYTGQDGVEKNTVDIIATNMVLLGVGRGNGGGDDGGGVGYDERPQQRQQPQQRNQYQEQRGGGPRRTAPQGGQQPQRQAAKPSSGFDDMDDDIPF